MKQGKEREVEGICSLDRVVSKGFTNKVAFAQKPECSEGEIGRASCRERV